MSWTYPSSGRCPSCCHTELVGLRFLRGDADRRRLGVELKRLLEEDQREVVGLQVLAPPGLGVGHDVLHLYLYLYLYLGYNVLYRLDLGSVHGKVASGRSSEKNPASRVQTCAGKARMGGGQPVFVCVLVFVFSFVFVF